MIPRGDSEPSASGHPVPGPLKILGFIVGLALLAAAVIVAWRSSEGLSAAFASASSAPVWLWACVFVLPILNWPLSAATLWLATNPADASQGRVSLGEMTLLTGTAWLLNYLPLRPGLLGRLAWHHRVNRIGLGRSIQGVLATIVASFVALVGVGASIMVVGPASWTTVLACVLGPAVLLAVIAGVLFRARCVSVRWVWPMAAAVRVLDVGVWLARTAAVFALCGAPLSVEQAMLITVAGQVVMLIPIAGNGLGLREWAVSILSARLGISPSPGGLVSTAALSAEIINRTAEMLVAVPVGLACSMFLARRFARSGQSRARGRDPAGEVERMGD